MDLRGGGGIAHLAVGLHARGREPVEGAGDAGGKETAGFGGSWRALLQGDGGVLRGTVGGSVRRACAAGGGRCAKRRTALGGELAAVHASVAPAFGAVVLCC